MELAIDVALYQDPDANLLGPFTAANADVEPLCIHKTIYLPAPFIRLLIERYINLAEAWNLIHGAIDNRGKEVDCRPIIDWISVVLTKKVGDDKSPLAML